MGKNKLIGSQITHFKEAKQYTVELSVLCLLKTNTCQREVICRDKLLSETDLTCNPVD